jgi:hypothetical protein
MQLSEEKRIRRWSAALDREIRLSLLSTGDPRTATLADFCDRLAALAPRVSVQRKKLDTEGPPAIGILPHLRYHGVPEANELAPFLEVLSQVAGDGEKETRPHAALARVTLPASLTLYVAPGCTYCPSMVRSLTPLAVGSEKVRLSIIDAALFQETAAADSIRSVPTLVFDGKFRFNGVVPVSEVMQMLVSRDPADLSPSVLLGLIEEGNAGKAAELMVSHRIVFPALIDLLSDEKWPRRLGAMVALESVAETDPVLAKTAASLLVERLASVSDAVKGDIVYLLGEIGGPEIAPVLEAVEKDAASGELAETAAEALERIRTK